MAEGRVTRRQLRAVDGDHDLRDRSDRRLLFGHEQLDVVEADAPCQIEAAALDSEGPTGELLGQFLLDDLPQHFVGMIPEMIRVRPRRPAAQQQEHEHPFRGLTDGQHGESTRKRDQFKLGKTARSG